MKHKPAIHPNTPRRLARAFKKNEYIYRRTATALGLNIKYVYQLIHDGREPGNPDTRAKLYLPRRHKTKPKRAYIEPPEHIKWWRCLKMHERHQIIYNLWKERTDEQPG